MTLQQREQWTAAFEGACRQGIDAVQRALDAVDQLFMDPPDGRYVLEQIYKAGQYLGNAAGIAGDLSIEGQKACPEEKATTSV